MVMSPDQAISQIREFDRFMREVMVEDTDYGKVPGVKQPFLWKSGALWALRVHGYYAAPNLDIQHSLIDWNREPPLFHYVVKVDIKQKGSDVVVGSGMGSCNSWESKYRYRESKRLCPKCDKDTIFKGKAEYGGGWICGTKKGGCGAKFKSDDPAITGQNIGREVNEDIADVENTILKMAVKRAIVDGALACTSADRFFTQDEDAVQSMNFNPNRGTSAAPESEAREPRPRGEDSKRPGSPPPPASDEPTYVEERYEDAKRPKPKDQKRLKSALKALRASIDQYKDVSEEEMLGHKRIGIGEELAEAAGLDFVPDGDDGPAARRMTVDLGYHDKASGDWILEDLTISQIEQLCAAHGNLPRSGEIPF